MIKLISSSFTFNRLFLFLRALLLFFSMPALSLTSRYQSVRTLVDGLEKAEKKATAEQNKPMLEIIHNVKSKVASKISGYESQLKECMDSKDSTDTNCLESSSKDINQFVSMMGSMSDVGGMAMSASCSKLADLLKMGQAAQAAFRGQCAFVKSGCVEKCAMASKTLEDIRKDLRLAGADIENKLSSSTNAGNDQTNSRDQLRKNFMDDAEKDCASKDPNNPRIKAALIRYQENKNKPDALVIECLKTAENEMNKSYPEDGNSDVANSYNDLKSLMESAQEDLAKPSDPENPSAIKKVCEATAQETSSKATMNIGTLMMSMQQNQACANEMQTFSTGLDLKDCNLTGTCTPTDPVNDCKDAKYKDSIYCKSYTKGTDGVPAGALPGPGSIPEPNFALDGKSALGGIDMSSGALGGDGDPYDPNNPNSPFNKMGDDGGAKSAGIPGGGGSGGLNIPGGGYNPSRGGGRGPSGGGGGEGYGPNPSYAGNGNFPGGGSGDKNKTEDLQKYLPGGEKDPTLKKGVGPEGITSPSGLTLFEKVTKSYRNNRGTLIPE